jgi:hypothetical protein
VAKNLTISDLVNLAKSVQAPGPILLAVYGLYGGRYAKLFDAPYRDIASVICLVSMGIGVTLVVVRSIKMIWSNSSERQTSSNARARR